MKGGRKPSAWNMFVKKIYHEGHSKNKQYSFKQALQDASRRKSEMGKMNMGGMTRKKRSTHRKSARKMKGTRKQG